MTEAGVAGCKWDRPQARPAALDAAPTVAPKPPAKKKRFLDRFRGSTS